jgi:sugar phosphate isomerase/epimerase
VTVPRPRRATRREFLVSAAALTLGPGRAAPAPATRSRFGIAYTSFAIRMLQGRDVLRAGTARGLPAEAFVELVRSFGGSGCQMDLSQLDATQTTELRRVREALEKHALFLELSVPASALEDPEAFARAAAVARELGTTRLRVALLSGRRYESFHRMEDWRAFEKRWRSALPRAAAWLEKAGFQAGIENHKDFGASELAEVLRSIGSPHLGACVDFGNNLSFLEEPMATVEALAPYAVTTHLKDMAVRTDERGFQLSEVPLGTGLLPLARMVEVLRKARPEVNFCLEMITRDPLEVPYLEDGYWVTYERRDPARVAAFKSAVLARASTAPLPRITGLTPEQMLAAEDANVRACVTYARGTLGL